MNARITQAAALTLVLLGTLTAGPPASAAPPAPAEGQRTASTVFTEVATASPAYAAMAYLQDELGLFNGYPDRTFGARRSLTRYEFAVGMQRLYAELEQVMGYLESRKPAARATVVPDDHAKVLASFRDAAKLRSACLWYGALLSEFGAELKLLGVKPERWKAMRDAVERWRERAGALAERAP
jgi:hypothetical protein